MQERDLQLFINGSYVESKSKETIVSINPENDAPLYTIPIAEQQDVDRAVKSAKQAFAIWSNTPATERANILRNAASLLRRQNNVLARIESLDTGRPIQETSVVDIVSAADCLDYYASQTPNLHGQHFPQARSFIYTRREPLGVCIGIGAWNYPLQIACWKAAPALACGNTIVFKPSEHTSLSTLKLAELFVEAGLPAGVFNVVTGDASIGKLLIQHPEIAKVSFTGSVATGKAVMQLASADLKKISMELGGKSPLIIFEDSDLDNAVSAAMLANFYSQGEICSNGTRVFVQESIIGAFLDKLTQRVSKIKIGSPLDHSTQMGPLISKEQLKKVMFYIESGINEGANLHYGGKPIPSLAPGNYIEPTIFTNCQDDMRIVKEEIFGPVMSVLSFESEDEVIRRANNTDFGLAAGVFTKDLQRAHRVIAQLQAGTCWINNYNITPVEMPFGGYKQSGIGRENGTAAMEQYTQIKSVYVELGDVVSPYN